MIHATIDGRPLSVPAGLTILDACRRSGIEIPTLCHDDRLVPAGACRLCVVAIGGRERPVTACDTPLEDGMVVETHTAAIVALRRTLLQMLARGYPADAVAAAPEKPFHRWLVFHGVVPEPVGPPPEVPPIRDDTHPYLHADLSRCITCFRCVRICDELQGQAVWRAWERGDATRIRPGEATTLLASECTSCGACADTCPTGAIEDQSVLRHGPPTAWTRTTCPYCGVGCELEVGTRDGRIVQARPAANAPVNRGHLCSKGRYAFDFVRASDRATEPMIRTDGVWRTASWKEATACVANNFRRILDASGPDSIGILGSARGTNEENYLAQKFARVVLGTNNVDCCARVCHAPTAAGMKQTLGTGAATNSFDDIERAASFLLCGCNPTESHPVVGARIRRAVRNGARLVVVDPRETELARVADIHLRLSPGTNLPLLNALAHAVLAEGLADADALADRVDGLGAFRDAVAEWTPERAAPICGVDAEAIRRAARLYATAAPAMCFHGLGVTEHVQGTDGVVALVNLALLTGNFGKAGSGVNPLRGQNNVQGSAHMGCDPGSLAGGIAIDDGRAAFGALWKAAVPRAHGLNLMEMVDAAAAGRLKALWAIGYDVAQTNPDSNATRAALAKVGFVVVQDLFLTELARGFGHVFLPACSSFEKDGTFMNSERRVQRVRRAVDPVGNSRADWEIIRDLAAAMGHGDQFDHPSPEAIWNEIRAAWPAGAGIGYARLERGGLQWPCPHDEHPGTAILHAQRFPRGVRAALCPVGYAPTDETTNADYPFLLTTGRTLQQFNAGTMTGRTPSADLRRTDTLDIAPEDAARLGFRDGERVRVRSRHGESVVPLRLDPRVKRGELFATFHAADSLLNQLTGPNRDLVAMTPEYKVVAVAVVSAT